MSYAEALRLKGIAEGKAETQLQIAKEMLHKGLDPNLVAEITKLSLAKIKTLH